MMNPPTEPSADMRVFARNIWEMFVALTAEGFSERQALVIVGQMLAATAPKAEGEQ